MASHKKARVAGTSLAFVAWAILRWTGWNEHHQAKRMLMVQQNVNLLAHRK